MMALIRQIGKQDPWATKAFAIKISKIIGHDAVLIGDKQGTGFISNPVGQLEVIGNQIDVLGNAIAVLVTHEIKVRSSRPDKSAVKLRGDRNRPGVADLGKDRKAISAFSR